MPVFDPLGARPDQHIDFNMMYRWFVGPNWMSRFGDHSTFSANRDRLLKESIMRRFFDGVLGIAEWADLVSDEHFSVDGPAAARMAPPQEHGGA